MQAKFFHVPFRPPVGAADTSVRFWSASSGKLLANHILHSRVVNELALHPSGAIVASGQFDFESIAVLIPPVLNCHQNSRTIFCAAFHISYDH
jgi:WD40 repeat protein